MRCVKLSNVPPAHFFSWSETFSGLDLFCLLKLDIAPGTYVRIHLHSTWVDKHEEIPDSAQPDNLVILSK